MSVLTRHPLVSFFVISYALTWAAVPFGSFFTAGPLIAAVIVVGLTQGRVGFRVLGRRLLRWRVAWPWYAAAVGVPLAVQALTFGLAASTGAGHPSSTVQLVPGTLLMIFAVRLVNPLDGPLAEEPGWRAFAQPQLQTTRLPLGATAILALLVTGWHLPLWLLPQFGASATDVVSDIIGTVAVTFWYAWLFNRTGGSALLTLISHAVEGSIHPQRFWTDPADIARATMLYSAVWCAVAVTLVIIDQQTWRRPELQPADQKEAPAVPGSFARHSA